MTPSAPLTVFTKSSFLNILCAVLYSLRIRVAPVALLLALPRLYMLLLILQSVHSVAD